MAFKSPHLYVAHFKLSADTPPVTYFRMIFYMCPQIRFNAAMHVRPNASYWNIQLKIHTLTLKVTGLKHSHVLLQRLLVSHPRKHVGMPPIRRNRNGQHTIAYWYLGPWKELMVACNVTWLQRWIVPWMITKPRIWCVARNITWRFHVRHVLTWKRRQKRPWKLWRRVRRRRNKIKGIGHEKGNVGEVAVWYISLLEFDSLKISNWCRDGIPRHC